MIGFLVLFFSLEFIHKLWPAIFFIIFLYLFIAEKWIYSDLVPHGPNFLTKIKVDLIPIDVGEKGRGNREQGRLKCTSLTSSVIINFEIVEFGNDAPVRTLTLSVCIILYYFLVLK